MSDEPIPTAADYFAQPKRRTMHRERGLTYDVATGDEAELADLAFKQARATKTRADARLAEIEVSKARGELVATVDVAAAWGEVLVGLRAKLLSIPTKAGAAMAAENDKSVIEAYLEDQIRDALDELSSYQPDFDPTGQSIRRSDEEAIATQTPAKPGGAQPKVPGRGKGQLGKKRGPYKPRKSRGATKK